MVETSKFEKALTRLESGIAQGEIWNTDFQEIKYQIGREYGAAQQALRDLIFEYGNHPSYRGENTDYPDHIAIYHKIPFGLNGIRGFKKQLEKARLHPELKPRMMSIVDRWVPICEAMYITVKPMIKKGRKPSENPADPRTHENTGTCAICGRNCKLDSRGNLVHHGYEVEYGQFQGSCYGTNRQPIEVSPKALEAYAVYMDMQLEKSKEALLKAERDEINVYSYGSTVANRENPKFEQTRQRYINATKYQNEVMERIITQTWRRIATWKPQTLPGIKAGFAR